MLTSDLLYISQFEILRTWLGQLSEADLSTASVLPGWSVRDLVAHLARTGNSISALAIPTQDDEELLTVAEYIAEYAGGAADIDQGTRDLAVAAGEDLLTVLDEAHTGARHRLAELGGADRIVRALRGPILLSDFLDTRVLELVVHSDDLALSLPELQPPHVLPSATNRLVKMLREVLTGRSDDPTEALRAASTLPAEEFILLAAGRRKPAADLAEPLRNVLPLF